MAESLGNGADVLDCDEVAGTEKQNLLGHVLRPPSKKKFEDEMEMISNEIRMLEDAKTKLHSSGDGIPGELRMIRAHKDDVFNKRKNIDKLLQRINQDIVKQNSELTKIESTLKYKSEERTNETINRLEQQLKMRNFTLREERRIVNEIDSLKRSKKTLGQYITNKKEIDGMKEKARHLREERERYHKEWTERKQKEEKLKLQLHHDKGSVEQIKKDLDGLYERRRTRAAEFKTQVKQYQQIQRHKQEELYRQKQELKEQENEAYQKELAEYEATRTPYQEEIQLCNTLIAYLQRFSYEADQATDRSSESTADSPQQDVESPRQGVDGMYVLKKKTDEELFGGVTKPKKKKVPTATLR